MSNPARQLSESRDLSAKVAQMLQTRTKMALERYNQRVKQACEGQAAALKVNPALPWEMWAKGAQYTVDFAQRSILFWDPRTRPCARRRSAEIVRRGMPRRDQVDARADLAH